MEEAKEKEKLTLVTRKPCFGLPTSCPNCLPVYVYLKFSEIPFDLDFNLINPDSDQIPYVESGTYVAYNNEKGGVIRSLIEDSFVDLDAQSLYIYTSIISKVFIYYKIMSTNNKVHSKGNVPFSWENKPGVSKITPTKNCATGDFSPKLPPPPCPVPEKSTVAPLHHLQIPLPPCTFQPTPLLRSSSKRFFKKQDDDPFWRASKECTKSSRKGNNFLGGLISKDDFGFGMKKNKKKKNSTMSIFSCKKSCSVMEKNSIIKVSHDQLPISRSLRSEKGSPIYKF